MRFFRSKPKTRTAKSRATRALLKLEDRTVEIVLRANPRAHRFIVKVDPSTGEVSVVAPSSRSLNHALDFARKEKEWIAERLANIPRPVPLALGAPIMFRGIEHIVRLAERGDRGPVSVDRDGARPTLRVSGMPEHAPRRVLDWLKHEARKRIEERVDVYARMIDVTPKRITIRDTSSRWGSCSSTRCLSFSWRLILAPPFVLDYVVAHEVAHLREMNHYPRFWRLVDSMVPHVARAQTWLCDNGALLHRYAPRQRMFD